MRLLSMENESGYSEILESLDLAKTQVKRGKIIVI